MIIIPATSWQNLKEVAAAKGVGFQYADLPDRYDVYAFDSASLAF